MIVFSSTAVSHSLIKPKKCSQVLSRVGELGPKHGSTAPPCGLFENIQC